MCGGAGVRRWRKATVQRLFMAQRLLWQNGRNGYSPVFSVSLKAKFQQIASFLNKKVASFIPNNITCVFKKRTAKIMNGANTTMLEVCHKINKLSLSRDEHRFEIVFSIEKVCWEWLDGDAILQLSQVSSSLFSTTPWEHLAKHLYGCDSGATADVLGGWRTAFAAFARVVRAGEERQVDVLAGALARMRDFSVKRHEPMAALARTICGATASALSDVHTRIALCVSSNDPDVCALSVASAMAAWPHDQLLQERGARSLVYTRLADSPRGSDRTVCDEAIRNAYVEHGTACNSISEAACAYALAVATEYAVNRRRRRNRDSLSLNLEALQRLAASGFYNDIAVKCLDLARQDGASELAAFYAAGSLRELASAAKVSRSRDLIRALAFLPESLTLTLHTLAIKPGTSDRLIRCSLSALNDLTYVSGHHRAIYRGVVPRVPKLTTLTEKRKVDS